MGLKQGDFDLEVVLKKIETISPLYSKIKAVYVFGSRIKGTQSPNSDLDIALLYEADKAEDFCSEFKDDATEWRHELRHIIPIHIKIDINPLDATDSNRFSATMKYVKEYSKTAYEIDI